MNEVNVDQAKLTRIQKKILEVRKTGECLSDLSEDSKKYCLDHLVLRGTAISGAALPNTEFFADIIHQEVFSLISEWYPELSYEEILLAMQLNSKGEMPSDDGERVEFYGATFNVVYLSKILKIYKDYRHSLDRSIQNQLDGYE